MQASLIQINMILKVKYFILILEKIETGFMVLLLMLVSQLDAQVFRYGVQAGIGFEQFKNVFMENSVSCFQLSCGFSAYVCDLICLM